MAPARWATRRAVGFAATSAAIGVGGHAVASGGAPSWPVLALATALLAVAVRPFAARRASPAVLLAGLVGAQALVHAACTLAPHGVGGTGMRDVIASYTCSATHLGTIAGSPRGAGHGSGSMLLMLGVHLLATIVGAAILLRLEALAFRAVRAAVRCLRRRGGTVAPARGRRSRGAGLRPEAPSFLCPVRRWLVASTARRGPPRPVLA